MPGLPENLTGSGRSYLIDLSYGYLAKPRLVLHWITVCGPGHPRKDKCIVWDP